MSTTVKKLIYLVHHESCSAWSTDREEAKRLMETDPLVQEVSYDEYLKACAAYGEEP